MLTTLPEIDETACGKGWPGIADIRLDQDVADVVVGEALGDIDADLRRRQPAQRIIGEAFAERGIGIAPGGQPAEYVITVGLSITQNLSRQV